MRIEDVVKAPARLEGRAVAAGDGERRVLKLDHAVERVGDLATADAEPPWPPARVAAERAEFAQVHHRAFEDLVAQHVGYEIGDITLGEAVKRNRHPGAGEPD